MSVIGKTFQLRLFSTTTTAHWPVHQAFFTVMTFWTLSNFTKTSLLGTTPQLHFFLLHVHDALSTMITFCTSNVKTFSKSVFLKPMIKGGTLKQKKRYGVVTTNAWLSQLAESDLQMVNLGRVGGWYLFTKVKDLQRSWPFTCAPSTTLLKHISTPTTSVATEQALRKVLLKKKL